MRTNHALGALFFVGLPLLLGNKGCEADLHEGDAEAVDEGSANGEEGTDSDGEGTGDAALSGGPAMQHDPSMPHDAGSAPQPTRDASAVPMKDAGATSGRCGTRGGVTCAKDEFCQFAPESMCGALDQGGTCMKKPEVCTAVHQPVCGCDGKTYSNACSAQGAGVSVARQGDCKAPSVDAGAKPPAGKTCGGFAGLQCEGGQFCNYEIEAGGQGCDGSIADGAGVCEATPSACTKEYMPVCGCDRHSYGNACEAHEKGVSVLHKGACTEVDCKEIGGRAVDGIGPPPQCASGETNAGWIVYANGQMSIEGTICCVK